MMQRADFIIVGQGIAGTLLADALLKRNKSVVIADGRPVTPAASEQAGGLLHAGAGKDLAPDPFIKQCLDLAVPLYQSLEDRYQVECITQKPLLIFKDVPNLPEVDWQHHAWLNSHFHLTDQPKMLQSAYQLNVVSFLAAARRFFKTHQLFLEEVFDSDKLVVHSDGVEYSNVEARAVVFCDGTTSIRSRYFKNLPFIKNRGDVLYLHIPDLPPQFVYEQSVRLVHREHQHWWCGSNHQWDYNDLNPDVLWRDNVLQQLTSWLKIPFEVIQHTVAERPTTAGQFPLAGMHPGERRVGILNGLGTRGLTLAPWYATHFAAMLCGEISQIPGYNYARFSKWLNG